MLGGWGCAVGNLQILEGRQVGLEAACSGGKKGGILYFPGPEEDVEESNMSACDCRSAVGGLGRGINKEELKG